MLKIRLFFKEQTALKSMFCQKNVHSVKNTLPCHFFLVFYEKSPAVKPIFGKKTVGFVKITLYFGSKKLIGCPSFLIFSRKNNCSNAHILSKNRPFSEKNLLLWPYYVKNMSTVVFVLNAPPPG